MLYTDMAAILTVEARRRPMSRGPMPRGSGAWSIVLLAALAMAACALQDQNPYHTSNQQRVIADGKSVVVTPVNSETEAQPFADDYCRRHGGSAHFVGMIQYRSFEYRYRHSAASSASFECVSAAS